MRKTLFAEGEYYHVYNRGVDKRDVFTDRKDYERFLFHLYACNDTHSLLNTKFHYRGLASIGTREKNRVPLVSIVCFCLMPNHFHLLLRQEKQRGIPTFLQKVGTAYTMYFNTRHDRSGSLFQGPYRSIHVPDDRYFLPLSRYIHLNPLDLHQAQWKKYGVKNRAGARRWLAEYPWSSYSAYTSTNQFPGLLALNPLGQMFRTTQEYRKYVESWSGKDLRRVSSLTIE